MIGETITYINNIGDDIRLPVLALRGLVVFPKMLIHFDVGRQKSINAINQAMQDGRLIFLTAQKDMDVDDPTSDDLYEIGVVASIKQILKMPGDGLRVLVEGVERGKTMHYYQDDPHFIARIAKIPGDEKVEKTSLHEALMREVRSLFEQYASFLPKMSTEMMMTVMNSQDPGDFTDYIAANAMFRYTDKQLVLEQSDVVKRLESLAKILQSEIEILEIEHGIHEKVKEQMDRNQREYYLREQMRVIKNELGESDYDDDEISEYRVKIEDAGLPERVSAALLKEVEKLAKLPYGSHEGSVIRGYLDTCLELPWNQYSADRVDVAYAKKILARDHYGLEKVKDRILDFIAVKEMAPDIKGQILCLVGPPGVGKTSIGRSIAEALGREYVRISLGGVRDEADIRGHRKTYIGAMPGRIITAIKNAGTCNPLVLLDEVDKLGGDYKGDPSSALLEVLDPEQNSTFVDHYVEIPFDLSDVMFITTANDMESIPRPLLDRMEVISLSSYTREEKFQIVKRHLLAKQMGKHGLQKKQLYLSDRALYDTIDFYTREAGVRTLERLLAKLCRKADRALVSNPEQKSVRVTQKNLTDFLGPHRIKPDRLTEENQVGIVTGLAWTQVGGEILSVEVNALEGNGKVELTGSLGDVMKESARAAISYIRSRTDVFGIERDFYKTKDIHIHVPEGAIPKDGPSAGITMATALVSELSGIPVRNDVAMTGEITLRGRVLPIGGLKEKTMAAYRLGVKTVIIPKDNETDLYEVDEVVKTHVQFVPAANMDEVLNVALVRKPAAKH